MKQLVVTISLSFITLCSGAAATETRRAGAELSSSKTGGRTVVKQSAAATAASNGNASRTLRREQVRKLSQRAAAAVKKKFRENAFRLSSYSELFAETLTNSLVRKIACPHAVTTNPRNSLVSYSTRRRGYFVAYEKHIVNGKTASESCELLFPGVPPLKTFNGKLVCNHVFSEAEILRILKIIKADGFEVSRIYICAPQDFKDKGDELFHALKMDFPVRQLKTDTIPKIFIRLAKARKCQQ